MKNHTTWTLLYIDYSTCTSQLYRLGHVSSTFNITRSLSGCCPSNIVVLLLKVSHNAPHVMHIQVMSMEHDQLHMPGTNEPY